jgi:hypothetical protein
VKHEHRSSQCPTVRNPPDSDGGIREQKPCWIEIYAYGDYFEMKTSVEESLSKDFDYIGSRRDSDKAVSRRDSKEEDFGICITSIPEMELAFKNLSAKD